MNKYDEKTTMELLHDALWYLRHVECLASKCMNSHESGNDDHDSQCYGNNVVQFRADTNELIAAIYRRVVLRGG